MTLQTGNNPISAGREVPARGFTLIEFVLVMALLATVFALAAPSLARFFRGRTLDSEARRFLALTRYGQSRAVAEGVPMILWIDEPNSTYGLRAESSYEEEDRTAVEFPLAKDVEVEVITQEGATSSGASPWKGTTRLVGLLPTIRFTPDGFISKTSPEYILFREGQEDLLWVGQNRNRLHYELQTNQPPLLR